VKFTRVLQFLVIGVGVGTFLPFFVSICLFGATLQTFVVAPEHTTAFWSGAPTPEPTPVLTPLRAWTNRTLSSGGGAVYILWSVLGAFAGEAIALRRWGQSHRATRMALLGAITGCVIFMGVGFCGLPQ
jgi:hypothetical protein